MSPLLRRWLTATAWLLLFMATAGPLGVYLWFDLPVRGEPSLASFAGFFGVFSLALVGAMQLITVRVFRFPARGAPKDEEAVRAALREVPSWMRGVEVREDGPSLRFIYTCVDHAYDDGLRAAREQMVFTAHLRFDAAQHRVRVTDTTVTRRRSFPRWGTALASWSATRGVSLGLDEEKVVHFTSLRQRVVTDSYRWNTLELQSAVLDTVTRAGWEVRYSLF